jgi:plastocyanin
MATNDGPAYRTTGKRMLHGMIILVAVMAVGAAIAVPNWHNFAKNPPPVSAVGTTTSSGTSSGGGASPTSSAPAPVPGTTSLIILAGAQTQGNPSYSPDTLSIKKGDTIQVTNKDTVPHTFTNGKDASDPTSGKLFDTSLINAGSTAKVATTKLTTGTYPFHCTVHPYMTGTLKVQ